MDTPEGLGSIGGAEDAALPRCPNCAHELKKRPRRRTKCPFCGQPMLVRTRPSDRVQVVVTEAGAAAIDAEWNQVYAAGETARLEKDAQGLADYAADRKWGLYRNAKMAMAELASIKGDVRGALALWLEVYYLDLNGPNNLSADTPTGPGWPRDFDPADGFLAPGAMMALADAVSDSELEPDEVRRVFEERAAALFTSLHLPLNPQTAWRKLRDELPDLS